MSRSGYVNDYGNELNLWRGTVARAIKGRRGQAFLREMLAALDALPMPRLIAEHLQDEAGEVCAIGSVVVARRLDAGAIDESEPEDVASAVGIACALAQEIAYINDEAGPQWVRVAGSGKHWERVEETPEERFIRVRAWVERQLVKCGIVYLTDPSGPGRGEPSGGSR